MVALLENNIWLYVSFLLSSGSLVPEPLSTASVEPRSQSEAQTDVTDDEDDDDTPIFSSNQQLPSFSNQSTAFSQSSTATTNEKQDNKESQDLTVIANEKTDNNDKGSPLSANQEEDDSSRDSERMSHLAD